VQSLTTTAPSVVSIDYFAEILNVKQRAVTILGLALAGSMVADNETTPTFIYLTLHQVVQALCALWGADPHSFYADEEGTLVRISLAGHRYVVPFNAAQRAGLEIINEVVVPILKEIRTLQQQ
jgi:hypothetical protein